jgi:lysozyme
MKILFWCVVIAISAGIYFAQDVYFKNIEKEIQEWREIECELSKERAIEWRKKLGDGVYIPQGGDGCLESQLDDFNTSVERIIKSIEEEEEERAKVFIKNEHRRVLTEWHGEQEKQKKKEEFLSKYAHIVDYIKLWECGKNDKACQKDANGNFIPYICAAGIKTIGWGHTATARHKDFITPREAEELLINDLQAKLRFLNQLNIRLDDFTKEQQIAIVGAIFNIGYGNFKNMRNTINLLRKGQFNNKEITMAWIKERTVTVKGRPNRGLIARRNDELKLILSI